MAKRSFKRWTLKELVHAGKEFPQEYRQVLCDLSRDERYVLERKYAVNGGVPQNNADIARDLKITEHRVRQLHTAAAKQLTHSDRALALVEQYHALLQERRDAEQQQTKTADVEIVHDRHENGRVKYGKTIPLRP